MCNHYPPKVFYLVMKVQLTCFFPICEDSLFIFGTSEKNYSKFRFLQILFQKTSSPRIQWTKTVEDEEKLSYCVFLMILKARDDLKEVQC